MTEYTTSETKEAVWAMYQEGYRPEIIAERLGCALRTVYVYMSEKRRMEGIPPRSTGFALKDDRHRVPRQGKKRLVSYAGAER